MHTHDEAALGVALVLYLLEHTITHVKVVTKNTANLSERVVKCLTLQQVNLDLLGCPDVLTELEIILDFLPESLALLLPDLQLLGESSIRIIRESHRLDEVSNERWLDVAELSRFDLADTFFKH